jgi:hypothetical protein
MQPSRKNRTSKREKYQRFSLHQTIQMPTLILEKLENSFFFGRKKHSKQDGESPVMFLQEQNVGILKHRQKSQRQPNCVAPESV